MKQGRRVPALASLVLETDPPFVFMVFFVRLFVPRDQTEFKVGICRLSLFLNSFKRVLRA